ncbi:MAG: Unknown protein [uncultured Aureispira sp.]|uniref:Fibrobacter succinogenes major paralogous domain-containing protein n=1 Tax=uncultured Aureispira sp. TaxID=1331704 RepID=A0A6S6UBM5_9BACT|nr:MAG: Unknown protein [uncultured Aureispira sp.]
MNTKIVVFLSLFLFLLAGCGKEKDGKYYNLDNGLSLDGTSLLDFRDDQVYEVIEIGDQAWMAEELRYVTPNSKARKNIQLYSWEELMQESLSSNTVPSHVQGICPKGWHVPSNAEWDLLVDYLIILVTESIDSHDISRVHETVAKGLKSETGWPPYHNYFEWVDANGTNTFGFNAFPSSSSHIGFWSSTESDSLYALPFQLMHVQTIQQFIEDKRQQNACRCLKN